MTDPADPRNSGPDHPGDPDQIPVAPSERDRAPTPRIDPPSLMDEGANADLDRCPNCNTPMPDPDAVVCMNCGWDLVANRPAAAPGARRVRAAETVDDDADESGAERAAIALPDKFGWRLPLAIGAAAVVAAATLAGVQAPAGEWLRPVVRVLLYAPIHVGLGFVALTITARVLGQRLGDAASAACRMALAVGLFYLCYHVGQQFVTLHPAAQWIIGAGAGAALYFLVLWTLYKLTRDGALMVAATHFVLWLAFWLLLITIGWLERSPTGAATPAQ